MRNGDPFPPPALGKDQREAGIVKKASKTRAASHSQLPETAWRQAHDLRMLRHKIPCAPSLTDSGTGCGVLIARNSLEKPGLDPFSNLTRAGAATRHLELQPQGPGAPRAAFGSWPELPQWWQPRPTMAEPAASQGAAGKSQG